LTTFTSVWLLAGLNIRDQSVMRSLVHRDSSHDPPPVSHIAIDADRSKGIK